MPKSVRSDPNYSCEAAQHGGHLPTCLAKTAAWLEWCKDERGQSDKLRVTSILSPRKVCSAPLYSGPAPSLLPSLLPLPPPNPLPPHESPMGQTRGAIWNTINIIINNNGATMAHCHTTPYDTLPRPGRPRQTSSLSAFFFSHFDTFLALYSAALADARTPNPNHPNLGASGEIPNSGETALSTTCCPHLRMFQLEASVPPSQRQSIQPRPLGWPPQRLLRPCPRSGGAPRAYPGRTWERRKGPFRTFPRSGM